MELWRSASNPWGQDVLIGISWGLMWGAMGLAGVFLVGHWAWLRMRGGPGEVVELASAAPAGIPERIPRHSLAARIFHWTMAASMLTLLVTAFAPVMGIQFPWVTLHWIAGVVLILSIVYHIFHAIGWQDFWSMMNVGPQHFREGFAHLKHMFSAKSPVPRAGKYPFDHRMYHHAIVVVSIASVATGALMMGRIDTPFWTPNPYWLFSDATWGLMYVAHGLAGVSFIVLIASHIYFAVRPEKRWITWSMFRGWVDREHYLAHHDPAKWDVTDGSVTSGESASGALADSAVSAPREDG